MVMNMLSVSADIANQNLVRNSMALRMPATSNRILDIPCKVCGDNSSGKHYNIFACDGCAGFFKRSIRKSRNYECKGKVAGSCVVDKTHRNQCRACRLLKCQEAGMNKEAVQHERGPRNSTLKRQQQQMVQMYNESSPKLMLSSPMGASVLDLSHPLRPPIIWSPPSGLFNAPLQYRLPFWCPPPSTTSKLIIPRDVCETAAGILFFNVKWAKQLKEFTDLPSADQYLLLEESWRDLFILGATQCLGINELNVMIKAYATTESNPQLVEKLKGEVAKLQSILVKIIQYRVDPQELTCLRAMALFQSSIESSDEAGSSSKKTLQNVEKITKEHENAQFTLNRYTLTTNPMQPLRFGQLLLLLPELKKISAGAIEDLFFKNTIGNVPIVTIILNAYKTSEM